MHMCEACGSPVTVHTSDEGTGCYIPKVTPERLVALEQVAERAEDLLSGPCDCEYPCSCRHKAEERLQAALKVYRHSLPPEGPGIKYAERDVLPPDEFDDVE
jgi:hypothetical protein